MSYHPRCRFRHHLKFGDLTKLHHLYHILLIENPVWPELVELDVCINCESTYDSIMESYSKIKELNPSYDSNVYGNGNSAKLIGDILSEG